MANHDHVLQPRQFMSVRDIGALPSGDYPGKTMNQVHAMFKRRELVNDDFAHDQSSLRGSVRRQGIQEPLEIRHTEYGPELGDGHHRFSVAKSLRINQVPVKHKPSPEGS